MSLVVGLGAFGGGVWLLVESVEGLIKSLRAWALAALPDRGWDAVMRSQFPQPGR